MRLPRERLLALGDRSLERRDTDRAIHFYESGQPTRTGGAGWSTCSPPEQELRAIELAGRYLVSNATPPMVLPVAVAD